MLMMFVVDLVVAVVVSVCDVCGRFGKCGSPKMSDALVEVAMEP